MKNCRQIAGLIQKLKLAADRFKSDLESANSDNIDDLIEKSKNLQRLLTETRQEIISPSRDFFRILGNPETIQKLKAIAETKGESDRARFRRVNELFENLPNDVSLDNENYQEFLKNLESPSQTMRRIEEVSYLNNYNIKNHLNSIFLNKFLEPDTNFTIDSLPSSLNTPYGFGSYLEGKKITLGDTIRGLGTGAKDSTFIAGSALDHVGGGRSENCHFVIRDISGAIENVGHDTRISCKNLFGSIFGVDGKSTFSIQKKAYGGIANCRAISLFCDENVDVIHSDHSSSTIIVNKPDKIFISPNTPGVVLVNQEPEEIPIDCKRYFYYDEQKKTYFQVSDGSTEPRVVGDSYEVLFAIDSNAEGIGIIENYSKFSNKDFCMNIAQGILILRKLDDKFPIGEGMSGGAIVVDILGFSPEEVKEKISKEREGGLILMRVTDPEDPGKTKLIDLESPWADEEELK